MIEKPFATDKECQNRRAYLVKAEIIKPCEKLAQRKVAPTKENSRKLKEELIKQGLLEPMCKGDLPNFIPLPSKRISIICEEGEYKEKPIVSDRDLQRRRQVYFRMMQEILYSRKKLKLILGKKNDNDPNWYF